MMVMYPRWGLVRAVNSVSKHSSVSRSSRPVMRTRLRASGFGAQASGFGLRGFPLPYFKLRQHFRQVAVAGRSAYERDMRRALKNLFAFLLRHASQHAKLLALGQQLLVVRQPMEDLLLRLVANGAGVVQNQVGLLDRLYLFVSLVHQRANDLFGVMHVHLAAEGFEVKGLVRIGGHG